MDATTTEISGVSMFRDFQVFRQPYDDGRSEWASLVANRPDATLYHGERWLESLRRTYRLKLELLSLADAHTGEMLAAGIFVPSTNILSRRYVSLPFSDSCALLAITPTLLPHLTESLRKLLGSYQLEIRGYRASAPWQVSATFVEWKLRMDRSASELRRNMAANFRRQLRRGEEAGFEVDVGHSVRHVQSFYELMLLTRKRFGLPAQPLSFFKTVAAIYADDCEIWLVTKGGVALAGMFLLREGDALYYRWSARIHPLPLGASHVMLWRMMEAHAGKAQTLNLGRNDFRNTGMSRFKTELGATSTPLPYSFFPRSPQAVSAERLDGLRAVLARVWQRTPLTVARHLGPHLYKLLS